MTKFIALFITLAVAAYLFTIMGPLFVYTSIVDGSNTTDKSQEIRIIHPLNLIFKHSYSFHTTPSTSWEVTQSNNIQTTLVIKNAPISPEYAKTTLFVVDDELQKTVVIFELENYAINNQVSSEVLQTKESYILGDILPYDSVNISADYGRDPNQLIIIIKEGIFNQESKEQAKTELRNYINQSGYNSDIIDNGTVELKFSTPSKSENPNRE